MASLFCSKEFLEKEESNTKDLKSFQLGCTLNNDQITDLILPFIKAEFELMKDTFKKFTTEKLFLASEELKIFIIHVEESLVSRQANPNNYKWLGEYAKTIILEHWRVLKNNPAEEKFYTNDEKMLDLEFEQMIQIKKSSEKLNSEINSAHDTGEISTQYTTPLSTSRLSKIYPRMGTSLENMNLLLICWNSDQKKLVEPDLELPASSCLYNSQAIASQSSNYSWDIFQQKFGRLLTDELALPVNQLPNFCQGAITYKHPDSSIRTIRNQDQFVVALNHFLGSHSDYKAIFNFFVPRETIKNIPVYDEKQVISINPDICGGVTESNFERPTATNELTIFGSNEEKSYPKFSSTLSHSQIPVMKRKFLKRRGVVGGTENILKTMNRKQKSYVSPRHTSSMNRRLYKSTFDQSWLTPNLIPSSSSNPSISSYKKVVSGKFKDPLNWKS